ncbi:ABC transporter substrate-binding protein [Acinetobacter puyangensis]|uniref:ABC transporter substrate-binding protein n=1 Tax=Acinetobacter puyangensis TaxID=1096779 RepID=UPI003A4E0586
MLKKIWGLFALIIFVSLFFILKPDTNRETNVQTKHKDLKEIQTIRIAVPDLGTTEKPSSGTALVEYIYVNKLLEKQFKPDGIQVEWHFFKGAGPAINEALVGQKLDVAFLGDLAAIIGKSNGIDTKLLLATFRHGHGYLAVMPNKGYKNFESLKGKRIAVFKGTAAQLSFDQMIRSKGYSYDDFRVVNMDGPAMNAALAAKQIDAGWGLSSVLALQQKGLVEVPMSTKYEKSLAGTAQAGLIARTDFIEQHPEQIQKVLNVVLQSAYWVAQPENRKTALELVARQSGYPIEFLQMSVENEEFSRIYSPLLDDEYVNHLKDGVNTALDSQLIKNNIDVDAWVDPALLRMINFHRNYAWLRLKMSI